MSYSVRRQRAIQALGVEQQPGGARVAVARLADAARVEDPLAVGDVDLLAAAARRAGGRLALGAHEGQRHVRVADQRQALGLGVEAQLGQQGGEDVLPDRDRAGDAW